MTERLGDEARFGRKVKVLESGCHIWQGHRTHDGYGRFHVGGKDIYAHRFAYERMHGPIPAGMQCDHVCNVRCCVNPQHLQAVTALQNVTLARVRAGSASIYDWEQALDDGLAVEIEDFGPTGRRANRARARAEE